MAGAARLVGAPGDHAGARRDDGAPSAATMSCPWWVWPVRAAPKRRRAAEAPRARTGKTPGPAGPRRAGQRQAPAAGPRPAPRRAGAGGPRRRRCGRARDPRRRRRAGGRRSARADRAGASGPSGSRGGGPWVAADRQPPERRPPVRQDVDAHPHDPERPVTRKMKRTPRRRGCSAAAPRANPATRGAGRGRRRDRLAVLGPPDARRGGAAGGRRAGRRRDGEQHGEGQIRCRLRMSSAGSGRGGDPSSAAGNRAEEFRGRRRRARPRHERRRRGRAAARGRPRRATSCRGAPCRTRGRCRPDSTTRRCGRPARASRPDPGTSAHARWNTRRRRPMRGPCRFRRRPFVLGSTGGEQRRPDAKEPTVQYILLLYDEEAESRSSPRPRPRPRCRSTSRSTRRSPRRGSTGRRGAPARQPATSVRVRDGEADGHRRPVRRDQGAARRLLRDRCRRPRRRRSASRDVSRRRARGRSRSARS